LGDRWGNVAWGVNEEWWLGGCRGADSNSWCTKRCYAQAETYRVRAKEREAPYSVASR